MYPSGIQIFDSRFEDQSDEDDEDCAIPPRPRRREIITEGCDPRTFVAKLFFPQCAVFAWQACDSRTDVCLATVCCCCFTLWCWEPLPRQRDLGRYAIEEAQQAPAQEELEEQDQDAAAMRKQRERDRGSAASIGTTNRTVLRHHAARGRGSAPACRFLCITCDPRDWCCRCWFPATAVYAWEGCDYPWNNVLSLCCCCLFTVCCWAMAARQKKWGISVDQYEALLRRWQEREAGLVSAGSGGGAASRRGERSRRLVVGDPMIAVSNFTNT
eukprot:g3960.t1